jgi:hypothetical protein
MLFRFWRSLDSRIPFLGGAILALGSCADDPPVEEENWYCQHFDVVGYIDGVSYQLDDDDEACLCSKGQPSQTDMDVACAFHWGYGDGVMCTHTDSITNQGACPDDAEPTGTVSPPDPPDNDCNTNQCFSVDGDCCNPNTETDCCCFDNLNCDVHDFQDPPHGAPPRRMNLLGSAAGSTIQLTVNPGQSYASSDSSTLTGVIGYSYKTSCGVTRCPFVLGEYEVDASDPLVVNVRIGTVTKQKTVSNLNIKLAYPAIGNHRPSTNVINFAAKSLVFLVEFDLSGPEFAAENGHYVQSTRNATLVTGTTFPSTKTWKFDNLTFDLTDVSSVPVRATFTSSMSLTDTSPASTHTQSLTCVGSSGALVLQSTASDADGDLGFELWWIDGALKKIGRGPFTTLLSNGTHHFEHRSFDLRGGYENTPGSVVVSCP